MAASGIHRRSDTPTKLAPVVLPEKEKFDAESTARRQVSEWVNSAGSFAEVRHANTPNNIQAMIVQYNAYGNVVSQQLATQITKGATCLELDPQINTNNRAFLDMLKLPDGYTLKIEGEQLGEAESAEASSAEAHPAPDLHPLSPRRPFAPQGGMVQMPLRPLTPAQKKSLEPLVEAFLNSVKDHADEALNLDPKHQVLFVKRLLIDVEDCAVSNGGDSESFLFELAAKVADWCERPPVNNKPLSVLVPHLPESWRPVFERDPNSPGGWHEPRALMETVERKTKPPEQVRPPVVRVMPPVVPTNLATDVNSFVTHFNYEDGQGMSDKADAILEEIVKVAGRSAERKMAMLGAVSDQLRSACARKKNSMPVLLCFASKLPESSQGLFLDVLMSDDRVKKAQGLVTSLNVFRENMDAKQYQKLVGERKKVVLAIEELPYQARMMVTNECNSELERIASSSKNFGTAIRELKIGSVQPPVPKMPAPKIPVPKK
ncbi:MAG: hypothetical protein H7346_13500 [Burkholderiaceae bacterium]|nr:hypothetical protein [Burkholderiaceae bacterium]